MPLLRPLKQFVKSVLAEFQRRRRSRELEQQAPHTTAADIADGLRAMGIEAGDVVFLHSSLKSLGFVEGGPRAVLQAFIDVIGEDGTLIVPTYWQPGGSIYATCRMPGYEFDARIHGTNMGALPAAFLEIPGVRRSIHPTHSVSAWGRHAESVTAGHHTAPSIFGPGSPWERCIELRGKVFGLGVSMGPVTFYHTLEDRMGASFPLPVRMSETFVIPCHDLAGQRFEVPVVPLDVAYMPRRIDFRDRADVRDYFWADFEAAGLLHVGQVGQAKSWYIEAPAFIDRLRRLVDEGITIYATAEDMARRPIPGRGPIA